MTTMSITGLPEVLPADPSDSELLGMLASLLAAMPGPRLQAPLSRVIENLCSACCLDGAAELAERLERELARYLAEWSVLRFSQTCPAGLDRFAADAPVVFLHAATVGCARACVLGVRGRS
jgi:hypothetical protein